MSAGRQMPGAMQNTFGSIGNNNRFNGSYNPYQNQGFNSPFGYGQSGFNAVQNRSNQPTPGFNTGGNQTIGTSPSGQLSFVDPNGLGVGNTQSSYSQPQNSTMTGNTFVDPNGVGVNSGYAPQQPPQQTYGGTAGVDPVTGRYTFY